MNTNNKILFSIITVVYNGEKYLEQTIKSIINQSYENFEYIIIDGGSTDKTIQIIKKYEKSIAYWLSQPDKGIYDAMNKGIIAAKGDYIGIVNSDDFLETNALQIINEACSKNKVDVLHGDIFVQNKSLEHKKLMSYKKGGDLKCNFTIYHPSTFVQKSAYDKYGLFDISYKIAGDYELLHRFQKKGASFHYVNKPISNFRTGGISDYSFEVKLEVYRFKKEYYSFSFALIQLIKQLIIYSFQKVGIKILGEKKYHKMRYKYLYN